jgi:glycosyltransferase involved in cell wall biosynthesis
MRFVTISDHNTLEGALRIAHLPDTFLSVEVTTRFPEDDVPLHVLVWSLTEEDHRDLQPARASVYELQTLLAERQLPHALAHPLYRMGPPLTADHVERLMLLFGVWEGRNGGRPREHNEAAVRLASLVTPRYLEKLAEKHGLAPRHSGTIALVGGSDDHGALDIATTWTEAEGETVEAFLDAAAGGRGRIGGEHGSAEKLAHALLALFGNAYRESGGKLPPPFASLVAELLDEDVVDPLERHHELSDAATFAARALATRARRGGIGLDSLSSAGSRLGRLLLAGALQAPFLATAHHHAGARRDLRQIEAAFFGSEGTAVPPRALIFTDTFGETNGVAGTMRRLAEASDSNAVVVTSSRDLAETPTLAVLAPEWSFALPTSEHLELRFPGALDVIRLVEHRRPDVIQVATPGPVGLCGLLAAKLLGIPVVGSFHTELGPYALHLTRDLAVAEAMGMYVDWFYRACDSVLAPSAAVARALVERGVTGRERIWSRGVDAAVFTPERRREHVRRAHLGDGDLLLLSVGRLSPEKRLDVLLEAFELVRAEMPGARLTLVGDGPARGDLEARAPAGARFVGELSGTPLAELYASADVFCFPSTTDTFGQVLLEASASALPVVAAATGGAPELVQHGVAGLLVAPNDAHAFADAVVQLARSRALRERLGAGGRRSVLERTWAASLRELRQAYEEVALAPASERRQRIAA